MSVTAPTGGVPQPNPGAGPLFTEPPPPSRDASGVLDFSEPNRPATVPFRVGPADDDVFHAAGALPGGLALQLMGAAAALRGSADEHAAAELLDTLRQVLLPQSADRFVARLSDPARPISLQQLVRIVQGLFAEWGLRPTAPPPGSSNGSPSPAGGTSSTAGSPWQAPTP